MPLLPSDQISQSIQIKPKKSPLWADKGFIYGQSPFNNLSPFDNPNPFFITKRRK